LRQILNIEEQLKLIDIVQRKGGLKDNEGNWNFLSIRGRHFSNIDDYPDEDAAFLSECTKRFKEKTEEIDATLAWPPVTHVLSLFYPDTRGIGWHKDGYGGNDGDNGAPVYSLTLGNSCIFEYKLVGATGAAKKVELRSGDIIVFGGPQRLMKHAVTSVNKGTFKNKEGFDARVNLTFRTCSDLTKEREAQFATEEYVKRFNKYNNNNNNKKNST